MTLPEQRIRLVAATPIQVGPRRLLPSVLVSSLSMRRAPQGAFRLVRLRPASIVVESEDGAEWIEIPNTTAGILSTMAFAGIGIALASMVLIAAGLVWQGLTQRR